MRLISQVSKYITPRPAHMKQVSFHIRLPFAPKRDFVRPAQSESNARCTALAESNYYALEALCNGL